MPYKTKKIILEISSFCEAQDVSYWQQPLENPSNIGTKQTENFFWKCFQQEVNADNLKPTLLSNAVPSDKSPWNPKMMSVPRTYACQRSNIRNQWRTCRRIYADRALTNRQIYTGPVDRYFSHKFYELPGHARQQFIWGTVCENASFNLDKNQE